MPPPRLIYTPHPVLGPLLVESLLHRRRLLSPLSESQHGGGKQNRPQPSSHPCPAPGWELESSELGGTAWEGDPLPLSSPAKPQGWEHYEETGHKPSTGQQLPARQEAGSAQGDAQAPQHFSNGKKIQINAGRTRSSELRTTASALLQGAGRMQLLFPQGLKWCSQTLGDATLCPTCSILQR